MKEYFNLLQKNKQFKEIVHHILWGKDCFISGLWGSSSNFFTVAIVNKIFKKTHRGPKILLVVSNPEEAEEDREDLKTFLREKTEIFPAIENIFSNDAEFESDTQSQRLFILNQIHHAEKQIEIVIAPIQALLQPVPSPKTINDNIIRLGKCQEYPQEEVIDWLQEHHYLKASQVENPGEYAFRGGIVDIFPYAAEKPYRIEYFGDEIESIRHFNPETQLSEQEQDSCRILSIDTIQTETMQEAGVKKTSLFEHFGKDTILILKESLNIKNRARQVLNNAGNNGYLFNIEEILVQSGRFTTLSISKLPQERSEGVFKFDIRSLADFPQKIQSIISELGKIIQSHHKTIVLCANPAEEQRFREIIGDLPGEGDKKPELCRGYINKGFQFPELNIAILAHHEIFHRYGQRRETRKPIQTRAIDSFLDLKKGDYVVHVAHGIGRFLGMTILEDNGQKREYLILEFDEGTKIYVPATKIELVQKYIGVSGYKVRLDKVNSRSWEVRKKRTENAVADVASDLLHIQALRNAKEGIAYPTDIAWQEEFELEFIYQETQDQLHALKEIKSDMESKKPMDRLICGDVGYGKTELAMRAAFKATMSGKQVAVLVPTTILAQQHYNTFTERMADYPIEIAVLSRLKPPKEQKDVIEKTAAGTVDILIGTHRLLQKDVNFKDLGLVIIDEEQRFGVAHKERFKKMRQVVDMLTLTATPIPRTLHMSLMGVKDISSLNTPPLGRQAIRTQIIQFDPGRIQQAIMLELNRNGQVYFVHNRVYNIDRIATAIQRIVPEARISTVHGQMDERLMEQRMKDFVCGKADILVSTTIIESGLDIPNVNTIFINCADSFGLADLHQLRGRVGRYKHHAYAYIILPPDRPVTPEAEKRLKALEEFAELGAGFKIAMRDLEIRGAV